ncbi:MAG: hypothetical protein KDA57_21760 [Planctomycetales bacterium]|nr:hypothetical protein [Planctomycetales bacterium]
MFDWILDVLSKASTWKGIVGLATAGGIVISPELATQVIAAGMAIVGAINLIREEKKK